MKADKEMMEYTNWIWAETLKFTLQALGIYVVLLGAYWLTIG
jgi:uncharacterized protein YdaU (DUF1376 family)